MNKFSIAGTPRMRMFNQLKHVYTDVVPHTEHNTFTQIYILREKSLAIIYNGVSHR